MSAPGFPAEAGRMLAELRLVAGGASGQHDVLADRWGLRPLGGAATITSMPGPTRRPVRAQSVPGRRPAPGRRVACRRAVAPTRPGFLAAQRTCTLRWLAILWRQRHQRQPEFDRQVARVRHLQTHPAR